MFEVRIKWQDSNAQGLSCVCLDYDIQDMLKPT